MRRSRPLPAWLLALAVVASPPAWGGAAMNANQTTPNSDRRETAVLAGGCFWGMEDLIRQLDGVIDTEVGYAGGITANPSYRQVSGGGTGHAESIRVVFDPARLSYASLLEFFFRIHDPTTPDRQGNDVGSQYRSAIFVQDATQKQVAEQVRERVDSSRKWRRPVVTQIVEGAQFWPAEGYHQDYLLKNPGGYTCHFVRDFTFE